MALIKSFIKQIRGVSYKPEDLHDSLDENSVILLRANNIRDGSINYDDIVYVDKSTVSENQYLQKGDILVCASSGSRDLVGKAAEFSGDVKVTFGAFCKCVRPVSISPRYLYHYFQSPVYRQSISNLAAGANINNIRNEHIDNLTIIVPDETQQRMIVDTLDKVTALISLRKKQIEKLDKLVKSRFLELFGDPLINEKGWTVSKLGEYMTLLTDFSSNGSYELLDSNVVMYDEPNYAIMVRTTDLESGNLSDGVKYIDRNAYELLAKSKIYGGELIMNKIGSAGKIYVMPKIDRPASLGRNAFMFRFDERLNMTYLYSLLTSNYGTAEIQQYVRGAVTKTITKESTRSIRIIVPPIALQEQFAAFVTQTDKSKSAIQKSLEQLETLKKSLMQKYFG